MIDDYAKMVREFHEKFGAPLDLIFLHSAYMNTRCTLIEEEVKEVIEAANNMYPNPTRKGKQDLLEELVDLQYVLSGFLVTYGLEEIFHEAFKRKHASNMTKLGEDGKPLLREDGKILKGKNYIPADYSDLI